MHGKCDLKRDSVVGDWLYGMSVYWNRWKCVGGKMSFCLLLYKNIGRISQEKHKSQLYTMRNDTYEEYVIKKKQRQGSEWLDAECMLIDYNNEWFRTKEVTWMKIKSQTQYMKEEWMC